MKIKYLLVTFILSISLTGCYTSKVQIYKNPSDEIYSAIQQKIKNGDWKQAIKQLEALDSYYSFGPCSQQAQLNLIYLYYRNSDLLLALAAINRFMHLNPVHPNTDYIIYMRGLTNMALDNSTLYSIFGIDRSDRDPRYARDALNDFSKLMKNYPNSLYVKDAINYITFLKNRLAKHEFSIVNHYAKRGAWFAVVNRVECMKRNYPNTQATRDGIKLMENAYRKMHMIAQNGKIAKNY